MKETASLDVGDRLVDFERLGDCDASLWADIVTPQTEKGVGNKIGMLLPNTVTKKRT